MLSFGLRIKRHLRGETGWKSKQITPVERLAERSADALKKIERMAIFGAGVVMHVHPIEPAFAGDFAKPAQHPMFDAASEDTAAQQERVHIQSGTFCFEDYNP